MIAEQVSKPAEDCSAEVKAKHTVRAKEPKHRRQEQIDQSKISQEVKKVLMRQDIEHQTPRRA